MPTPSDIFKVVMRMIKSENAEMEARMDARMDAKIQEFLLQMFPVAVEEEVQVVDAPVVIVSDDEDERTRWTEDDWKQIAVCYKEGISARVAHRLFPHLKEGSIGCKYRELKYVDTNGEAGFHGSASSREKARIALDSIRE